MGAFPLIQLGTSNICPKQELSIPIWRRSHDVKIHEYAECGYDIGQHLLGGHLERTQVQTVSF